MAINIPLALLFAFAVLFLRGKSANLLSIGAVDFGIIVDSSVIMVENIYRHLSSGEDADLPLQERILRACREVERSLFFSTVIMVCAFLPLFTMTGPEGQIFGPMADTYAFALGGALLLALTVSPVLCLLFFRNLKPAPRQLPGPLAEGALPAAARTAAWTTAGRRSRSFGAADRWSPGCAVPLPGPGVHARAGRRQPVDPRHLPDQHLAGRGGRQGAAARGDHAQVSPRSSWSSSQIGRPDDGTDPTGYYNVEFFVPLQAAAANGRRRPSRPAGGAGSDRRPRTKAELIDEMNDELTANASPASTGTSRRYIRDNVMESLSGVKGENSVKIFGPDLDELETAGRAGQGRARRGAGRRRTSASSASRASRTWSSRRPREVQALGRQRGRRRRRRSRPPSAARPSRR